MGVGISGRRASCGGGNWRLACRELADGLVAGSLRCSAGLSQEGAALRWRLTRSPGVFEAVPRFFLIEREDMLKIDRKRALDRLLMREEVAFRRRVPESTLRECVKQRSVPLVVSKGRRGETVALRERDLEKRPERCWRAMPCGRIFRRTRAGALLHPFPGWKILTGSTVKFVSALIPSLRQKAPPGVQALGARRNDGSGGFVADELHTNGADLRAVDAVAGPKEGVARARPRLGRGACPLCGPAGLIIWPRDAFTAKSPGSLEMDQIRQALRFSPELHAFAAACVTSTDEQGVQLSNLARVGRGRRRLSVHKAVPGR